MQEDNFSVLPSNRLQFFPVMMFAIIMGLAGLTIVYQKANDLFGLSLWITDGLILLTSFLFCAILLTYFAKAVVYPSEVKKEFAHPIRINFFAAISISFLLLSIIFKETYFVISFYSWYIGAILHLFFTLYTLSFWINKTLEIQHSNPAWFIPIVGNLVVPVAGVDIVSPDVTVFYFSIGIFFWIILFSIILNRLIFHKQFAQKFMPTLFILIAPPSIGFIAYVKITAQLDMFAMILYNLGLFFTFLIFFMYKNFTKIKFFISWWAFTFPLATITLASMLMYDKTHLDFYLFISYFLIFSVTMVVLIVAYQTIVHMKRKEICIME